MLGVSLVTRVHLEMRVSMPARQVRPATSSLVKARGKDWPLQRDPSPG
jgi:hypothetical protein